MVNVDVHVTKRRPLKGAVLFTVLVVMIVMLILMITTIGLASNASRRAYSEYNDHQTHSTARSVVESVVNTLSSENQALGIDIVSSIKNPGQHVDLQVNNGNALPDGMGTVNSLTFTNVGSDSPSSFNISGSGKPIIKVTAVVTQGGVTSSYSQYCIGDAQSNNQTSSGGGLIALGGFEGVAEPGVDAHSPAYFGVKNTFDWGVLVTLSNPNNGGFNSLVVNSSAQMLTSVPFSFGKGEGASIMGNLLLSNGTPRINWTPNDTPSASAIAAAAAAKANIEAQIDSVINDYKATNELSEAVCNQLFNEDNEQDKVGDKNLHNFLEDNCKAADNSTDWTKYNNAKKARQDVDNLRTQAKNIDDNMGAYDTLNDYYNNAASANAKDNPYLFVKGTLYLHNGLAVGSYGAPVNVYCGRIVTEANGEIYGNANIYCYNDINDSEMSNTESYDQSDMENFGKNTWSKIGTDNMSRLLSWAEQTTNPAAYRNSSIDTGSFATMGNLRLTKQVSLAGDLFVKGDLFVDGLNGGSHINGNVYVAGELKGDRAALDNICDGTIYDGGTYDASALPSRFTEFLNGDLKYDNLTTNIVKMSSALKDSFYVDKGDGSGEKTFKDAVNESKLNVNASTIVYTAASAGVVEAKYLDESTPAPTVTSGKINEGSAAEFSYNLKITDSCILSGDINKVNILIQPDKEIFINCFNINLKNNANILIDDSKGKVSFFFPTDPADTKVATTPTDMRPKYNALFSDTANAADSAHPYKNSFRTDAETNIQTLSYYTKMKKGEDIDLISFPKSDSDPDNDWMLPKVGFYSKEPDGDYSNMLVQFTNNIFFTGDICMPGADFYAKSGCTDGTANKMTYNGKKIKSGKIGCIGSIIVNKIKEFNNDFGMVYVDDPVGGPGPLPGGLEYTWTPIEGYADY